MSRKRVIYQSEALFVGPTGTPLTPDEINRVQSANYSFEIARTDINEFGKLARIDSIIVEQPTVALDFSYYPMRGVAETSLGFLVGTSGTVTSAITNMLDGTADTKNYYIYVAAEGSDAQGFAGTPSVIGIGNASLTSFSVEGSVGEILKSSVNCEGLNMRFSRATTIANPAISPTDGSNAPGTATLTAPTAFVAGTLSCLRPGDVTLNLGGTGSDLGLDTSDLKVQSFNLSFDLGREPLQKLGSRFATSREIEFPVTVTLKVDAILGDLQIGTLSSYLSSDTNTIDASIRVNQPNSANLGIAYELRGAKLDSQEFSSSIGDNKSVSLTFSAQIGGPEDTLAGLFMYNVV